MFLKYVYLHMPMYLQNKAFLSSYNAYDVQFYYAYVCLSLFTLNFRVFSPSIFIHVNL